MTTDRALELAEAALHEQRSYAKHHNQGAARELELESALDELEALRELHRRGVEPSEPWGGLRALENAYNAFDCYSEAKTPFLQAHYLVELSNAMGDLVTWHPRWRCEVGRIERAQD